MRELKPHANELDPKFSYLLEAPEQDPDGRPAVIRFSRKEKQQYVQSEEDGKATGWRATYQDGRWVQANSSSARKSGSGKGRKKTSGSRKSTAKSPAKRRA